MLLEPDITVLSVTHSYGGANRILEEYHLLGYNAM